MHSSAPYGAADHTRPGVVDVSWIEPMEPGWREWLAACLPHPCTESYESFTEAGWVLEVAANEGDREDAKALIPMMIRHPHYLVRKRAVLLVSRFDLAEFAADFPSMLALSVEDTEYWLLRSVVDSEADSAGASRAGRKSWSVLDDHGKGRLGEPVASIMAEMGVRDVLEMSRELSRSSLGLLDVCALGVSSPDRLQLFAYMTGLCEIYLGVVPHDVSVALLLALNRDYARMATPFGPIRALGEAYPFSYEVLSELWKGDLVEPIVTLSDPRLLPILRADDEWSRQTKSVGWPEWAPVVARG